MAAQRQETYSSEEVRLLLLEQKNDSFYEVLKDLKGSNAEMRISMSRLSSKIDANFKFLLTTMISGFVGMFGIMAHGFHWIV